MDLTNSFAALAEKLAPEHAAVAAAPPSRRRLMTVTEANFDVEPKSARTATPVGAPAKLKDVFQLSGFPAPVDPASYISNDSRDRRPLEAFSKMVDPVPSLSRYYDITMNSVEQLWGTLLQGARSKSDNPALTLRLGTALQNYSNARLPSFSDAEISNWWPVMASPEKWYDAAKSQAVACSVSLQGSDASGGVLTIPGPERPLLDWISELPGRGRRQTPLDPNTKLKSLHMKGRLIQLRRSWLDFSLLQSPDIVVSGCDAGRFSSGSHTANDGMLPLIPTAFMIAHSLSIEADWAESDRRFLIEADQKDAKVLLGNFALDSGPQGSAGPNYDLRFRDGVLSTDGVQIIGWQSVLVPYFPQHNA